MEGLHTLRDLVKPGNYMVKVDLNNAYFAIPIHAEHRKFLRFQFEEKTFEFNCLPFGLSPAAWVFTKISKPMAALLRELGVRLIVHVYMYINDILLLGELSQQLKVHTAGLTYLIECLGFVINPKKCILDPTQVLEFLGTQVNMVKMQLKLPGGKMKKIHLEAGKLLGEERISIRKLSRLLEKMNATFPQLHCSVVISSDVSLAR